MIKILVDGRYFTGPYVLDKNELPRKPGIALICTEAGEGLKIMTILQGDDINTTVNKSSKRPCWNKHSYHGRIDVYIDETETPASEREKYRISAISKRKDVIFCDEPPKIEDDW
ncbi:MAG: hypothetical protein MJY64_01860 [archaeon]|nr:hypothetical protein [archaeon]